MAEVVLKNVGKVYSGDVRAVKDINLEIIDKQFCVLVGPSGCGKSTILRMIAGLEEITEGDIYIEGERVNDIPPKDRNIAMVFQSYALYPHMTVYENMSFVLRLKKYPKDEIDKRVRSAAKILGLDNLLSRRPKALSGGQRQRVAVGRAIVRNPKVFLFDEPLSNLDAKLRVQMRTELKKLHEKLQATMIYVTHDQVEAMTMGNKIAVLKEGILQQVADPLTLYYRPVNKFVAGFIGSPPMNFMDVKLTKKDDGIWIEKGTFKLKLLHSQEERLSGYPHPEIILGIRSEDIYDKLYTDLPSAQNVFKAMVEVVEPLGAEIYLHINTGKDLLVVKVDPKCQAKLGEELDAVVDMSKIHLFNIETEDAIL
ncbi:MAG: sn-glycerol-3-phosphate ABC transporter ATP-binding protein UgpC [Elusimicrobia bacterium]|nr:sn-glycerol-3-phosphate ABC transporter ATP-binding protein UgpC [Elusimicrobiota bacterium]